MHREPLDAVVLAYDGLCTFEFGIVIQLFGRRLPELDEWYRLRVARVEDGPLKASGGVTVEAPHSLGILDRAGTIIVPGWRSPDAPVPSALVRKLRKADREGARLLSICSGAFVLAAAGLLDGKRAATHWRYVPALTSSYPSISVDEDVLYVDEGNIITSAGSAAGMDMGLHLIRRDFGATVANAVARQLVVPPHREGGQKQYIEAPVANEGAGGTFARLLESLRGQLGEAHTVESMARGAGMSKRNFARRFRAATGTTPHRWLQRERVRLAQRLLETTELSLEGVAERSGFSDSQLLRHHFKREVGTPPSSYRRSFRRERST